MARFVLPAEPKTAARNKDKKIESTLLAFFVVVCLCCVNIGAAWYLSQTGIRITKSTYFSPDFSKNEDLVDSINRGLRKMQDVLVKMQRGDHHTVSDASIYVPALSASLDHSKRSYNITIQLSTLHTGGLSAQCDSDEGVVNTQVLDSAGLNDSGKFSNNAKK